MNIIMKMCLILLSLLLWPCALPVALLLYLAYLCGKRLDPSGDAAVPYIIWPALIVRWIIWRD